MYVMDFVIWRHLSVNARILLNWFVRNGTTFHVRKRACGSRESDSLLGSVAIGQKPVLGERDYG